jgi:hypothetical protein
MAVRNDNYGGDFNGRLQFSVHWLSYLTQKYRLQTELILVNYNPLPDQDGLDKTLQWPSKSDFLRIRMITVPEADHLGFVQPKVRRTVPLFEFIAKNIGIRRATGQFILCTNADILFSESLMEYMAVGNLEHGVLYRCDRYDFSIRTSGKRLSGPAEVWESLIRSGVFRFYLQGGTYTLRYPKSIRSRMAILTAYNDFRRALYRAFSVISRRFQMQYFLFQYHCHASGDMALLDRESWFAICGYREDTWISTHTDSLQVVAAGIAGFRMEVLPFPVYHQHHERRYNFGRNDPDMNRMFGCLVKDVHHMQLAGKPIMNPPEGWGLPGRQLDEVLL